MCIAIYKPKGKVLSDETLHNCYTSNRDGAGFAYVKDGEVNLQKGFFSFDKFLAAWREFENEEAIIHFRIATHRLVNGQNCHPWRVNDDLVFIHNGMISGMHKNGELSDTGNFCDSILKPLMESYPDFYLSSEFKWLVENSISIGNKLIFLDAQGRHLIIHEDQGYWDEGCWFSNTGYRKYGATYKNVLKGQGEAAAEEAKAKAAAKAKDAPANDDDSSSNATSLEDSLANTGSSDIIFVETLAELDAKLEELNNPKGTPAMAS